MILRAGLIGVGAAVVVEAAVWARLSWPTDISVAGLPLSWIAFAVLVVLVMGMDRWRRRLVSQSFHDRYSGLSDLLLQIHGAPGTPHSKESWTFRGLTSFFASTIGLPVGTEGAGIELAEAAEIRTRPPSTHWFELQRRTDVACAISAGVSAAFGAPFAAILIPLEVVTGGRMASTVVSAVVAYLVSRGIVQVTGVETLGPGWIEIPPMEWTGDSWIWVVGWFALGIAAGLFTWMWTRMLRSGRTGFSQLFEKNPYLGVGVSFGMLALLYGVAPATFQTFEGALFSILSDESVSVLALQFGWLFLALILVVVAFGTAGVFWPILLMGASLGGWIGLEVAPELLPYFVFGGASAFFGSFLGAPLAGAVLTYELTGDYRILAISLLTAWTAQAVRGMLGFRPFFEEDLDDRGSAVVEGRSLSVLESLKIRDAMVTEVHSVMEYQSVDEVRKIMQSAAYPFLGVTDSKGFYVGMLTADAIEDAWNRSISGEKSVGQVLQARDLLYDIKSKVPAVSAEDLFTVTTGLFDDTPVVPVIDVESRLVGWLFSYSVRIVYDREVGRRSVLFRG